MQILRGLNALPDPSRAQGCIATVGVFDGVHLGHFQVLRRVVARAHEKKTKPVVVTFAGHPKELLLGRAPATVTSLDHRLLLFKRVGIRSTLVLEFTEELRDLSADQFVRQVLLEGLGMQGLVLGFDSKFGKDQSGNYESIQPLAEKLDFYLEEVGPLRLGRRAVSSTAIREAVSLGEFDRAAKMLGRPVSLLGTVVRGDGRGRQIGIPTANLDLHHEMRPPEGVYAALALHKNELLPAVVNIGNRPTFGKLGIVLEVHVLDFEEDLYGADLEIFFLKHLRGEKSFSGPEALVQQIHSDIATAREVIAAAPNAWRIPGEYLPIEGPGIEDLDNEGLESLVS